VSIWLASNNCIGDMFEKEGVEGAGGGDQSKDIMSRKGAIDSFDWQKLCIEAEKV